MDALTLAMKTAIDKANEGKDVRLMRQWPNLLKVEPCFMGAHSFSALSKKWRWIHVNGYLNFEGSWATVGQIAREYLAAKFKLPVRATRVAIESAKMKRQPPIYASVGEVGYAAYIDLKAAYWSIMNIVGWNCDYRAGKYLGRGEPVTDFPLPNNKQARNAIFGATFAGDTMVWDGTRIVRKNIPNRFVNNILQAAVYDILNGIAHDMIVRAGARYVNTDGYIIPIDNLEVAEDVCKSWGLPYSIKAVGEATVYGIASYVVGDKKTVHQWKNAPDYANVNPVELNWLRYTVNRLSYMSRIVKP